ncbi:chromosome partitioning protein, ParB family [Novimethylophilus kurashikiensis]|uniref:Chromosome partitioning protein, ParB family n=1 Tax=Novimethylophilus kurashikiensis TaxID=1825523 RepID=A0A2R5FAC4_9PROT|nr:ParB/RepB/Spo0J family partition protein [Novimethylophilus kurashikiensis]GBG14498.1 chromosome partitioning protein, ParB family [Novimethylophilus kurashikiensis]
MSVGKKLGEITGDGLDDALALASRERNSARQVNKSAPGQLMQFRDELQAYEEKIRSLEAELAAKQEDKLPLELIDRNPEQPRIEFDQEELVQLARDIEVAGDLIHPILVRPSPEVPGRYQLIAGERRVEAYKLRGETHIPGRIREVSDADMALLGLLENIGRVNLSDYEISKHLTRIESKFRFKTALISEMRMKRSNYYRLKSFDELPDFVLSDLDSQPSLLGAAAAQEIKSLLDNHGDKAQDSLGKLWPEFVSGAINQSQLTAQLKAAMTSATTETTPPDTRDIHKLFFKGTQAGSITKDQNHFIIKIKASSLTPEIEHELRSLTTKLYTPS